MKQEDIERLLMLYSNFIKECERVSKIICNVPWGANRNYSYADKCSIWTLEEGAVCGYSADEDGDTCEFPIHFLTMSDQQLHDLVEQINCEYLEKENEEKH